MVDQPSGWDLDADEDGYLSSLDDEVPGKQASSENATERMRREPEIEDGELVDVMGMHDAGSVGREDRAEMPPLEDDSPRRSRSGPGLKKKLMVPALVGGAVLLAAGLHEYHQMSGSVVEPEASVPVAAPAPASSSGYVHKLSPAPVAVSTKSAVPSASAGTAKKSSVVERPSVSASSRKASSGAAFSPASAASTSNAANLGEDATGPSSMPAEQQASSPAITAQLTEIEGELAAMRKNPGVDTKKLLKRMSESLSSLELKLGATQAEVGKLSSNLAGHVSKHPVLSGYRLLAVVGDQAVVEDMGTGRVAVLKTNGHLGNLSVYQVSGGEVVTNYGVFGG